MPQANPTVRPSTPITTYMDDPDQQARRQELRDFIGPNAEVYLATYDFLVERRRKQRVGEKFSLFARPKGFFVWLAFLGGPIWFFYRRMWLYGWAVVGLIVILSLVPITSRFSLPIGIALGFEGRNFYVWYAILRLQRLRAAGPVSPDAIAEAGGLSPKAGWISGGIYIALLLLGVLARLFHPNG